MKNLYILMAVLAFSMPFTTLAQHATESVRERHVAESDAKRDSKRDVNGGGWSLGGFVGYGVGALIAAAGAGIAQEGSRLRDIGRNSQTSCLSDIGGDVYGTGICLMLGGFACASFIPLVAVSLSPTPRPDRLLGKSPAYVDTYVRTYKKSVRIRRGTSSSMGCLSGFALSVLFALQ